MYGPMKHSHPPIVWDESYSVGVALLDQHHRHLAELINRLAACAAERGVSENVAGILEALVSYAEYHFHHEEAMMEEAGYPGLAAHREEHLAFCERIADTCYTAMHGLIAIDLLLDYLTRWWKEHILSEDMNYRSALAPCQSPAPLPVP